MPETPLVIVDGKPPEKGGGVTLSSGFAATGTGFTPGSIIFKLPRPDGKGTNEVLRMDPNGDVFVYGQQVDRETEGLLVYATFKSWLAKASIKMHGPDWTATT